MRGQQGSLPPRPDGRQILFAGLGGVLAVGLLSGISSLTSHPWVLGSFGASSVLVFGFPESPFSQPRNVVLGHLMSSAIGLLVLKLCGPHGWAMGLAVGMAIVMMVVTRTVHPPAGSNPVIVFLSQPDWPFLLFPTLSGALVLVLVAVVYLNLTQKNPYPKYWVGRSA